MTLQACAAPRYSRRRGPSALAYEFSTGHFERGLQLFRRAEQAGSPATTVFIVRAQMIAPSRPLGIAAGRGELAHADARAAPSIGAAR